MKTLDIDATSSDIIDAEESISVKGGHIMTVYFIFSFFALIASLFFFTEAIVISPASLVPVVFIGISITQAILFHSQENEPQSSVKDAAYSTNEVDYEAVRLCLKYHVITKLALIPVLCILILYLGTAWKILLTLCIYILSFPLVRLLVKLRQGR